MKSPYDPPKTDPRKFDRYLETIDRRDGTDWGSFFFILVLLSIFFFHKPLFNFFVDVFKNL